jgi:hypothetical protein
VFAPLYAASDDTLRCMRSLFQTQLKRSRILRRNQREHCVPSCCYCRQRTSIIGVIDHMNTKMILAALALSLSLFGCAKKEPAPEAAPAASEAAPAATDAAPAATETAPAPDAAAPAEENATPPAETPPKQ